MQKIIVHEFKFWLSVLIKGLSDLHASSLLLVVKCKNESKSHNIKT
jgi:hypothetical protein